MPTDWNPPVPDINRDFSSAHDGKAAPKPDPRVRGVVTKSELEKLEGERDRAVPRPAPAPPGMAVRNADYERASREREERIRYIKERMGIASERLRTDFGRASPTPTSGPAQEGQGDRYR